VGGLGGRSNGYWLYVYLLISCINTLFRAGIWVLHAFQKRLSAEKTPTLGDALPAFEAMISQWEKQQVQHPETAHIVQQGIDKLESYRERVEDVPAYILSIREFKHLISGPLLTRFQLLTQPSS
jgi:hypothetical protein